MGSASYESNLPIRTEPLALPGVPEAAYVKNLITSSSSNFLCPKAFTFIAFEPDYRSFTSMARATLAGIKCINSGLSKHFNNSNDSIIESIRAFQHPRFHWEYLSVFES
jgi:hypothetical protein